jgi:hypothetical protein
VVAAVASAVVGLAVAVAMLVAIAVVAICFGRRYRCCYI